LISGYTIRQVITAKIIRQGTGGLLIDQITAAKTAIRNFIYTGVRQTLETCPKIFHLDHDLFIS